jgi:hypothetical protein
MSDAIIIDYEGLNEHPLIKHNLAKEFAEHRDKIRKFTEESERRMENDSKREKVHAIIEKHKANRLSKISSNLESWSRKKTIEKLKVARVPVHISEGGHQFGNNPVKKKVYNLLEADFVF